MIVKLANAHVGDLLSNKYIKNKKRAIAKYSFIAGFKTAILLLDEKDQDPNAIVRREEKREEITHKSE